MNIPFQFRAKVRVPKNLYDFIFYHKGHLFPSELKSTKAKSISFSESVIKAHQIKSLTEADKYEGVIPGFIFNFREPKNKAYFVPIHKFNEYKNIAENGLDHTYKSKVNRASIPIGICEEIGIELKSRIKRTRYNYYIKDLFEKVIKHISSDKGENLQ